MTIRDSYDRQAHDIICMLSYGSQGGGVRTEILHKVGDYLRGKPFERTISIPKIEVKKPCKPIVVQLK